MTKLKVISESEAEEMYREDLDELKEEWIKQYYGGDVLKEIDPIAYNLGLREFIDRLPEQDMTVEEQE